MKEQISIALVDDHMLVRNGIRSLLEQESNFVVIAEGNNGRDAIKLVKEKEPDVLIIDVRMPVMNGIEAVKELQKFNMSTRSIVLSMHDSEEYILQSIKSGAHGYLLKDTDRREFVKAIRTVHEGGKYFSGDISNILVSNLLNPDSKEEITPDEEVTDNPFRLTKKEREVLKMVLSGKTNAEISALMNNSRRTIETHRFNLMKKMQVKNLMELASKARANNLD